MTNLWQITEIKSALKDQIIKIDEIGNSIGQVVIDSRAKTNNGLFVAFKGENNDGHDFLKSAFENGAIAAIVERVPEEFANDKRLILVKNSITALEQLAIFSRHRTRAKIIGVTGSVGKTSVKEMLKNVFEFEGKTFATVGNLNNHFGLPLTLCNMPQDADFAVLELAMNHLGEIDKLSKIARPHVAIITTIAAAHIGNFKDEEEIALAKSEIFNGLENGGFAVINADNKYFEFIKNQALSKKIPPQNIISFGKKEISDIRLIAVRDIADFASEVTVLIAKSKQKISYKINNINQAVIFNSLIGVACLSLIGKNFEASLKAFENLTVPKGRGNLINATKGGANFTIIDDSYNANLESMHAGIKFLSDLKAHKKGSRAIAFVGDMLELGEFSEEKHLEIATYIAAYNIDKVLLVGKSMKDLIVKITPEKLIGHFDNSMRASEELVFVPHEGDIILVKGSRGTRMEKLIEFMTND